MKLSTLSIVPAAALACNAFATINNTLVADTYIVKDGAGASAKFYSVLDIYVKGNHVGDVMAGVLGLNGTAGYNVVFATSQAQGTGLTRDGAGRITAGTITSDIFKQAGNSSWMPTYAGAGAAWDSFVTNGARKQNASVTNRASVLQRYDSTTMQAATDFLQMTTANSNFINNGGGSGWYNSLGANPYNTAAHAEVPFARLSLYNAGVWDSTYTDLDRAGLQNSRGQMQNGVATASSAVSYGGGTGTSLDFCYMVGRFSIDVTGKSASEVITMNAQFNMVGRNGTAVEAGTIFTGADDSTYRVSNFFTFAVPTPGAIALLGTAGLLGRRRRAH